MAVVYEKTKLLTDKPLHYCPGCTHGIIHRLVAEAIDELGVQEKTIGIAPVGCAVFAYDYFNCDMMEAAHGRAPAVATGCKRVNPNNVVFTYQGDGDLASIGAAEITHAYPIRVSEMLATLDGPAYIARVSVHDVKHIMDAKKCIKKAFETQIAGKGFSMVEVLSACPTNWGMTPQEALKWLEANMIPQYPLGVKKEVE